MPKPTPTAWGGSSRPTMQESLATTTTTYNNSNNSSNSSGLFNNRATTTANDNFNGSSSAGGTSNDTSFKSSTVPSLRAPRTTNNNNNNNNSRPSSARNRSPISRNPPAHVDSTFVLDDDDFAEDLAALQEIEEAESNLKVLIIPPFTSMVTNTFYRKNLFTNELVLPSRHMQATSLG